MPAGPDPCRHGLPKLLRSRRPFIFRLLCHFKSPNVLRHASVYAFCLPKQFHNQTDPLVFHQPAAFRSVFFGSSYSTSATPIFASETMPSPARPALYTYPRIRRSTTAKTLHRSSTSTRSRRISDIAQNGSLSSAPGVPRTRSQTPAPVPDQ